MTTDLDLLTTAEVMALADANSRTAPTGIRNRALVLVLAATGIRVQEALDLLPKDVDLEGRRITLQHGKGDKRRVVPNFMPNNCDEFGIGKDIVGRNPCVAGVRTTARSAEVKRKPPKDGTEIFGLRVPNASSLDWRP